MRRNIVKWMQGGTMERRRLYVEEDAPLDAPSIKYSDFDVFISHKSTDLPIAELIGETLHAEGLSVYLDRWDPGVSGDTPELEDYLRRVIRETRSILAVVTKDTPLSWWVPFEIGVARETESQIATYLHLDAGGSIVKLPSFLKKWPRIASQRALSEWGGELATGHRLVSGRFYFAKDALSQRSYEDADRLERLGRVVYT